MRAHRVSLTDLNPLETCIHWPPSHARAEAEAGGRTEGHINNRSLMNTVESKIMGTYCLNKDSASIRVQESTPGLVFPQVASTAPCDQMLSMPSQSPTQMSSKELESKADVFVAPGTYEGDHYKPTG